VKRVFMVEGAAAFPTKAEFINALYAAGASSVTELDLDAIKRQGRREARLGALRQVQKAMDSVRWPDPQAEDAAAGVWDLITSEIAAAEKDREKP
jgi:hypothetical protein